MKKRIIAFLAAAVTAVSAMPDISAARTDGRLMLEWSAVSDAEGYYVYRSSGKNSKLIGRVKGDTCCIVTDDIGYRYSAAPYYINQNGEMSLGNKFRIYSASGTDEEPPEITVLPVKNEPEIITMSSDTQVTVSPSPRPRPVPEEEPLIDDNDNEQEPEYIDDDDMLIDDSDTDWEEEITLTAAPARYDGLKRSAEASVSGASAGKTAGISEAVTKAQPAPAENKPAEKKTAEKKSAENKIAVEKKSAAAEKPARDKNAEKKSEVKAVKKTLVYKGIMLTSPAWSSKTVCTAPKNSKITVEGQSGNFYYCSYNGKRGYIYKRAVDGGKALSVKNANAQNLDLYLDDIIFSIGGSSKAIYRYVHSLKYNAARIDGSVNGIDSLKSKCDSLAASMIKNQSGMCYHYAALSQKLLERAGYKSKLAYCTYAKGGFHCYNIIESGGKQSYFDACRFASNDGIGYLPERSYYMKTRGLDPSAERIG